MLYLTCNMIPSVDLALFGISRAKDLGILGIVFQCVYKKTLNKTYIPISRLV